VVGEVSVLGNFLIRAIDAVDFLITLYMIALFAVVLVSWFAPRSVHPAVMFLRSITRPVLGWMRRKFPFVVQGGFDLSPMLAFFALYLVQRLVLETLRQMASRIS
jgi:uncharacterized protein YggT (Ycf19 family)